MRAPGWALDVSPDGRTVAFTVLGQLFTVPVSGGEAHQVTEGATRITAEGGRVGVASHGNQPGLGTHLEIWALASGGMTRHEVLCVATLTNAEALRLERDLGSLEPTRVVDQPLTQLVRKA